ncbi:hypothetical protein PMAYCL1PPCAC_13082 [Pristionchus mayeri]|uniref:Uncharacterized protein n=1 Tax=Pristionchus mayeri TaxID=1317129 RepID=A0AAN5CG51_9BILA|nr:hypothetical protein PMAYCL1PPCAC_13082 [Pristionchus mayeri]
MATSVTRGKRSSMDDMPHDMQFFKWSEMGKLSPMAIKHLRKACFGKPKEVARFMYKLMEYYDDQMEKEKKFYEMAKHSNNEADKKEIPKPSDKSKPNLVSISEEEVINSPTFKEEIGDGKMVQEDEVAVSEKNNDKDDAALVSRGKATNGSCGNLTRNSTSPISKPAIPSFPTS